MRRRTIWLAMSMAGSLAAAWTEADFRSEERRLKSALVECGGELGCRMAAWNALIALLLEHEETSAAAAIVKQAKAARPEQLEARHPERLRWEGTLGGLAFARGDYAKAIEHYERAWYEQAPEPAVLLSNWGLALIGRGSAVEGIGKLERARAALEERGAPQGQLAVVLGNLAVARAGAGDASAGRAYGRAIEISERVNGREHPTTAQLRVSYGRYLESTGRRGEGKRMRREAETFLADFAKRQQLGLVVEKRALVKE